MLPTCLTSWALEEFETVPRRYVEQRPGERPPSLEALLKVLRNKNAAVPQPKSQLN